MSAFEGRYKSNKGVHVKSWDINFLRLEQEEIDMLEVLFSEEEIQQELMGADGNKVLGPNSFQLKFVKTFWSDLKGEVLLMFDHFFVAAEFDQWFSSLFILLVPKVSCHSNLNYFRPIFLFG